VVSKNGQTGGSVLPGVTPCLLLSTSQLGIIQEMVSFQGAGHAGIIVRCISDCVNEIYFLLEEYPNTTPQAHKFIGHFKSTAFSSEQESPPSVPSKKIHNATVRYIDDSSPFSFEYSQKKIRNVYEAFSGYVHSNYPHIKEIYGGPERKFHMEGVPSIIERGKHTALIYEFFKMTRNALGFFA